MQRRESLHFQACVIKCVHTCVCLCVCLSEQAMLVQYQERSVEADRRLQEESIICPGSDSENSVLCPICQKYACFCLSCLLVCLSVDRVQDIMVVARGYCYLIKLL